MPAMRTRLAAVAVSTALLASTACGGRQLTNRQVVSGVVGAGAIVGVIVLLSLVAECEQQNGGMCGDPDQPPPYPR